SVKDACSRFDDNSGHACYSAKIQLPIAPAQVCLLAGKEKFVSRLRVAPRSDGDLLFGIFEDFSFVVANHNLFMIMIQNISGVDRNFASPSWRINNELRYGVACCVAA